MACTKNGRIRKLIKHNENKTPMEARKATPVEHLHSNWYAIVAGNTERREEEIKRLKTALTGVSKKGRMRKFAHKKQKATETKAPKGKKGKG
jgi:hypothetical protein